MLTARCFGSERDTEYETGKLMPRRCHPHMGQASSCCGRIVTGRALFSRRHRSAGGPGSSSFIGAAASLRSLSASHRCQRGGLGGSLYSAFFLHGLFSLATVMASYLTGNLHMRAWAGGGELPIRRRALQRFSLLSRCAKTVSESHLLRTPGLLSSEEQIPQIVVNVRSWRKTMETLESMMLLDTHEVRDSSSLRPTIYFQELPRVIISPQTP
jgi:hypothetical protein